MTWYVYSSVRLCVCLFVCVIILEQFDISSWNFYESNKVWSDARMSSKMAAFRCTAACVWWFSISDILLMFLWPFQDAGALYNCGGFHGVERWSTFTAVTTSSRSIQAQLVCESVASCWGNHSGLWQVVVLPFTSILCEITLISWENFILSLFWLLIFAYIVASK